MSDLEQQRYNYRFDNNGRPINMNPLAQFNMAGATSVPSRAYGELEEGYEDLYNASGRRVSTRKATKDSARNGAIVSALKTI